MKNSICVLLTLLQGNIMGQTRRLIYSYDDQINKILSYTLIRLKLNDSVFVEFRETNTHMRDTFKVVNNEWYCLKNGVFYMFFSKKKILSDSLLYLDYYGSSNFSKAYFKLRSFDKRTNRILVDLIKGGEIRHTMEFDEKIGVTKIIHLNVIEKFEKYGKSVNWN